MDDEESDERPAVKWVAIGRQGFVAADRIVAVAAADSAPVERLVGATALTYLVGLTAGQKRRAVLVMDSGHVVLTAMTVAEVWRALHRQG